MRSIRKRIVRYRLLVPVAAMLACAGCARRTGDRLTVAMSLAEAEWQVLREEIFPLFEQRYGLAIASYQIESGNLETKLEALQAAGKASIDVFAQDNMSLAALVNKNLVRDLSEYEDRIPDAVMSNLVDACRFDGTLYFMPFRPNVQIVYYNADALSKYGLPVPETWDALLRVGAVLKEKEGIGRIAIKAYGGNPTATQIYEFVLQAGGDPYAFDDAGCVKAFTFLQQLGPCLSPESQRAKWDTVNDILARRQAYLAANWPFGVRILVKDYGLDFIRTYSGWKGPAGERHVIGGDVFGIPRTSARRADALKFMTFMQSREVQEKLVARLGWPSARRDAYAEVPDWQKPHFEAVREALRHGVFRENVSWWPLYTKYVTRAFKDIVMRGAPVQSTLTAYKHELEAAKQSQ